MNSLKAKMNNIHPLTDETWNKFKSLLTIKEYPPKHELSIIGKKSTKAFFSLEGYTRSYMITDKGKEINCHIFPAGSFFCSIHKFNFEKKC